MFCPNCGTQNPETAATCTKCNFNLKGAAAPKFKGTMLMMNNPGVTPAVPRPPTPAGAAPPPGGPLATPAPGELGAPLAVPMPSKLKGTMVGVAPPTGGIPPTPPRPPSFPPAGDVPPPPAFVTGGQGMLGTPAPFPAPPGPVNPLGGTIAAGDQTPFGYGGAPPAQAAPQQQPGSGGFGGGGYGQGPGAGQLGPGQGGPPPGFGGPPQQQQQQQQSNDWGQPPMQQQQQMGMMGMGAPQNPGMAPYGQQPQGMGMMPPQGQQGMMGQAMTPGGHGPKGVVRNGTMELVYSFVSCGLYQMYYYLRAAQEINTYLGREAVPFWKVFLLTSVTCGLYGLYWQATQCGAIVQEMQQRAGLPGPQNLGILYVVPYYNMIVLQTELNKVWQSPG